MKKGNWIFRGGMTFVLGVMLVCMVPVIFAARNLLRIFPKFRRISIWTGAPIINMALNSRVERMLGFSAFSVVVDTYFITNEFSFVLTRLPFGRLFLPQYRFFMCALICVFASQVHMYLDGGILPNAHMRSFNKLEIALYRTFGIRIFFWTYGGDCRTILATKALGEPNCCTDCTRQMEACVCSDDLFSVRYQFAKKYATAIFSMGDMIEYTPGSINNLYFWPLSKGRIDEVRESEGGDGAPLRIVHAPNHRMFKGTCYIEKAVETLRHEGMRVELILVERIPNKIALEVYKSADIIVDQVLGGFHGFFALEALALSKPVVCFIRDPERYLIDFENCPIINARPDNLVEVLREWVSVSHEQRRIQGERGRAYVERNYSNEAFAKRLGSTYRELGVIQ